MKFCARVRLKPSNDRGEFDLDRARSKNNMAENSFALGHETDTKCDYVTDESLNESLSCVIYYIIHGLHDNLWYAETRSAVHWRTQRCVSLSRHYKTTESRR